MKALNYEAIAKIGVPAFLAVFLTFWLTQTVSADLQDLKSKWAQHTADQEITRALLYAICVNLAETDGERAACDAGRAR